METNAIIEKILTRSNEVLQNIPTKFKRRIKKRLRSRYFSSTQILLYLLLNYFHNLFYLEASN